MFIIISISIGVCDNASTIHVALCVTRYIMPVVAAFVQNICDGVTVDSGVFGQVYIASLQSS